MTAIRIYEQALCCDTGVCGVDLDEALVTLTADVRALQERGIDIARHNLASDPGAFTADDTVRAFMHTVGSKGLPLTVVDGVTAVAGTYPTRDLLLTLAGAPVDAADAGDRRDLGLSAASGANTQAEGGCCGGADCC